MTEDEIRISLNLQPFDEFAKNNAVTGRTTRMLCKALSAMSNGKYVAVVGYSHEYSIHLRNKLKKLAEQIGLDTNFIVMPGKFIDMNANVFYDHYVPTR